MDWFVIVPSVHVCFVGALNLAVSHFFSRRVETMSGEWAKASERYAAEVRNVLDVYAIAVISAVVFWTSWKALSPLLMGSVVRRLWFGSAVVRCLRVVVLAYPVVLSKSDWQVVQLVASVRLTEL